MRRLERARPDLDGATAREKRENRDDRSKGQDEPEKAADSRSSGDRQNDQSNYEHPEESIEGVL
jgi:hypothetical protein